MTPHGHRSPAAKSSIPTQAGTGKVFFRLKWRINCRFRGCDVFAAKIKSIIIGETSPLGHMRRLPHTMGMALNNDHSLERERFVSCPTLPGTGEEERRGETEAESPS